jgi:acyl dehydratase
MDNEFQAPIDDRYFEDYIAGHVHEFGSISVSEAEIVEFGRRYDPQPFHTSAEAVQVETRSRPCPNPVRGAEPARRDRDVGQRDEHVEAA